MIRHANQVKQRGLAGHKPGCYGTLVFKRAVFISGVSGMIRGPKLYCSKCGNQFKMGRRRGKREVIRNAHRLN